MNEQTQRFYEIAAIEVASNQIVTGVMAKAFADNNGDEKGTIAAYIRLRVAQLEEQFQQTQQAEAERKRAELHRTMSRLDAKTPPSLMRLAGRFYGRHPLACWAIIMGIVVAIVLTMI